MPELVVYRAHEDGSEEIGVMTLDHHGLWVDVGDFEYYFNWNRFDWPFTIIGFLN